MSTGIAEISSASSAAMAGATGVDATGVDTTGVDATGVDAKAALSVLMDEWGESRQGTTEQLVSIFTK